MSKTRRAIVAIVSIVVLVAAVVAIANPGRHHRPAPAAAAVRVITPAAATPPASPAAGFETDAFLNLLTRVDPSIATQLINAVSPADRAALGAQVKTRIGLAAG
jgi:hypothetical protein